jgi:PAS domain-containing protein
MAAAAAGRGDGVSELRERKELHDAAWLTSLLALVVAIVVASRSGLVVGVRHLLFTFLAYVLLHAVGSEATRRTADYLRLSRELRILHLMGVVFVFLVWIQLGGVRAPLLLLAFALPLVSGSILALPGQAFLAATVSTVLVAGSIAATTPAIGNRIGVSWMEEGVAPGTDSFRPVALLLTFAILQLALAVVASVSVRAIERLHERVFVFSRALENVRALLQGVLGATPVAEVLVHADSGRVVRASNAFRRLARDRAAGRSLFDLLTFDDPGEIRDSLLSPRCSETLARFTVGNDKQLGNVVTSPIRYGNQSLAHVTLVDESHVFLRTALEALDEALVLVDADERIAYCNPRAIALLDGARPGEPVAPIATALGLPRVFLKLVGEEAWHTRAALGGREYAVHTSVLHHPGLGRLGLVVVRPVAAGTVETPRPLAAFHAPRFFTETVSRFLNGPSPQGSFALVVLETDDGYLEQNGRQARFVGAIESALREQDVFLGLRPAEFGLLAPGQGADETAKVLERARAAAIRGEMVNELRSVHSGKTRLRETALSSVVTIVAGDDLDSLVRRAMKGIHRVPENAAP